MRVLLFADPHWYLFEFRLPQSRRSVGVCRMTSRCGVGSRQLPIDKFGRNSTK